MAESSKLTSLNIIKDPQEAYVSLDKYAVGAREMLRLLEGTNLTPIDRDTVLFLCRVHFECGYMMGTMDGMEEARVTLDKVNLK